MTVSKFEITLELACHQNVVEELAANAFGPGRFARTAFRLREGCAHEKTLSFVALLDDEVIGSVRVTNITIGNRGALVLGPLVVDPAHNKKGVGNALMKQCVSTCKEHSHELVILVGDLPYYQPFGFQKIPHGKITMPGPVDRSRFLYCELVEGVFIHFNGMANVVQDRLKT